MLDVKTPRLREVTAKTVEEFLTEYKTYVGSVGRRNAASVASLFTAKAKDDLSWKARMAKGDESLELPEAEGHGLEDWKAADTTEQIEAYFRGVAGSDRSLMELLKLVVKPASRSHATEEMADESLSLKKGLKSFDNLGPDLAKFELAAKNSRDYGALEPALIMAFQKNFLRHYQTFAQVVKGENPKTLNQAIDIFAREARRYDAAAQRVRNHEADMGESMRPINKRLTLSEDPEKLGPKRPKNTTANPRNRGKGVCFGCGAEPDKDGKPTCTFLSCKKGPWVVGDDYRIRHANDEDKIPAKLYVPHGLRGAAMKAGTRTADPTESP